MSPAFAVSIRHKRVRRVLEQDLVIMFEFGSFRILEPFLTWRSESLSAEHIGSLFKKKLLCKDLKFVLLRFAPSIFSPY